MSLFSSYDDKFAALEARSKVEEYPIDVRDLLNLLRHAYLFGWNTGLQAEREGIKAFNQQPEIFKKAKDYNQVLEDSIADRDADLQSLIEDWKAQGYESYNDDLGSLEE